jgi:plastocyanin
MFKPPGLVLSACALTLGLAACGGSSGSSSTPSSAPAATAPAATATTAPTQTSPGVAGGSTAALAADPGGQLMFTTSALSATAGKVTIKFTNSSPLAHNLTIQQGSSGAVLGATPTFAGGNKTLALNLKPGTYTFYCSVPGHRQAGMQGTLTVR